MQLLLQQTAKKSSLVPMDSFTASASYHALIMFTLNKLLLAHPSFAIHENWFNNKVCMYTQHKYIHLVCGYDKK